MSLYNKCDICALKVIFDQHSVEKERNVEDFMKCLRALQEQRIVPKGYNRRIFTGGEEDKSEMCSINSEFWTPQNAEKKCPHFILSMNLPTAEAMSLHMASETENVEKSIHRMTRMMLYLAVATALLAGASIGIAIWK